MESGHILLAVFSGCGVLVASVAMVLRHFREVAAMRFGSERDRAAAGELEALRGEVVALRETVGSLVWVIESERRAVGVGREVSAGQGLRELSGQAGDALVERVGD